MVKYDPSIDDSDLRKMFESIDEDKNGTITLKGNEYLFLEFFKNS
jgi:Ca2+-binding EF-hand superfamily protein